MIGHQGQALSLIFSLLLAAVAAEQNESDRTVIEGTGQDDTLPVQTDIINTAEFRRWIELEEERVVQQILEKIAKPEDSTMQHEVKVAVARYLVNITFTEMTRRLGMSKISKKQSFIPATAELPASALPEPTGPPLVTMLPEAEETTTPQLVVESVNVTDTPTLPPTKETLEFIEQNNITSLPSSSSIEFNETTTVSSSSSRPFWQDILNFNFSAAFMGGGQGGSLLNRIRGGNNNGSEGGTGGNLFSRFNLTALGGGGGGEGGNLLSRLNLTALGGGGGGEGGNLLSRLNLTALGGGGEGGSLLSRLNLTALTGGGEGGGLLGRLNLTSLRGNGSLFERLNISLPGRGNGQGGIFSRFNLSAISGGEGGGGLLNRFNLSSAGGEGGGNPFNIPTPPEGFLNYPTPPPKNDSVRLSQMALGSQVEKLMGDINNTNLTGIVESTINIASPATVGVLVNALLNIVLCNPLDRFNGNCGIE